MRRRLSTLLNKYEPRLLSRSTTILKPSSNTCCSIVSRTFAGAIVPRLRDFSLFGVRFCVEGVSARTGAILIRDRNLLQRLGQWRRGMEDRLASWLPSQARLPDLLHDLSPQSCSRLAVSRHRWKTPNLSR